MQFQPPSLFRPEALQRLGSPEQLDRLMTITGPRNWLALAAIATIVVSLAFFSFGGTPPVQAGGSGILLHPPGINHVETASEGLITELAVKEGDAVHAGQALARLRPVQGPEQTIVSRQDGTVVSLLVAPFQFVLMGASIVDLEPATDDLEAVVYLPVDQGKNVRTGMPARISPATAKKEEVGVMLGTVASVSPFPVSAARIRLVVGDATLQQALTAGEPVYEVRVQVLADPGSKSGVKWSSGRGPGSLITSGTLCEASIVLGERTPLHNAKSAQPLRGD